jgi:hypothetical protein
MEYLKLIELHLIGSNFEEIFPGSSHELEYFSDLAKKLSFRIKNSQNNGKISSFSQIHSKAKATKLQFDNSKLF